MEITLSQQEETGDIYYGASCLTKYWVHDDERECIAYNTIYKSKFDDTDEGKPERYFGQGYPWQGRSHPWNLKA